jgi:hypothetical protein
MIPRYRSRAQEARQREHEKKVAADMLAATTFYCSWGRHTTRPDLVINEQLEHGTMCWECQMKVTENLRLYIPMPELTAALRETERLRMMKDRAKAKAATKIKAQAADGDGFVYYIRINGQIKIGYAADITARMRHYPPGSQLLAAEPGTMRTELERHQKFRNDLVKGREWFTETPRISSHISSLVESYGDPSALAYEFTKPKG